MALAGPRLDRPSAIGDEGRPRAASLWIATLATIGLVVAVGVVIGEPLLVTGLATAAGLTVAGIALLERAGLGERVVGNGLLILFGSAFAVLVAQAFTSGPIGIVVSGCTLALFGLAMAWANVDNDGLRRGFVDCAVTYGWFLVSAVTVFLALAFAIGGLELVDTILETSTPTASIGWFAILVLVTGGLVVLSLGVFPFRALARRDRRDSVERRVSAVCRAIVVAMAGAVAASVGLILLLETLTVWAPDRQLIPVAPLVELSSPLVVWPLLAVGFGTLLVTGGVVCLKFITRQFGTGATRHLAALAIGAPMALGFVALAYVDSSAFSHLMVGPLGVMVVIGALILGIETKILPARAGGRAVAAGGLVIVAIGLAWTDPHVWRHSVLAFACLAAAAFVWDVSTFGLSLTAELGHVPETRRLELFHGVLSLGVAVSVVLVLAVLEWVRLGAFEAVGGPWAVIALGLAALILLVPLRG